jgi:WD40 repeat protein
MLFAASYEEKIRIWEFPNKFECNLSKILISHKSMVTALEIIDEKNLMISVDDTSCLKCWDLSKSKCIQTYNFDFLVKVQKIIFISDSQFITVSSRLHLFTVLALNY